MFHVEKYNESYRDRWDKFVLNESINGTFLQTRAFLEYHGERFNDESLIIYKGNNSIVAVIPACVINDYDKKIFYSHAGSTFGGIVISNSFYNIAHVCAIMDILDEYLVSSNYSEGIFKFTGDIFSSRSNDLLYYFMFQRDYESYEEISFYIDFAKYNDDIALNFSSSRRRDYKYSLKNNMTFRKVDDLLEIKALYHIICENLKKFNTSPVHTLEEIIDLKENRIKDNIVFYAAFLEGRMIAGSIVFLFKDVFHTQYLACDQNELKLFPMNFLDFNLIKEAKNMGYKYFSFGTSTMEHGKILNKHLAEFKEGFGTEYTINRTFHKFIKK